MKEYRYGMIPEVLPLMLLEEKCKRASLYQYNSGVDMAVRARSKARSERKRKLLHSEMILIRYTH